LELRLKSFHAIVIFSFLLLMSSLLAAQEPQDKDGDKKMQATPAAQQANKNQKKDRGKDQKKDDKKDEAKEEKKGGMTADTFSGLKFRLIGPAVASGRVT
jgi:hypothetical protein